MDGTLRQRLDSKNRLRRMFLERRQSEGGGLDAQGEADLAALKDAEFWANPDVKAFRRRLQGADRFENIGALRPSATCDISLT